MFAVLNLRSLLVPYAAVFGKLPKTSIIAFIAHQKIMDGLNVNALRAATLFEKRGNMEIIREGNPETITKLKVKFTCDRCGCIWIADGSEFDEEPNAYGHTYRCACPYCKRTAFAYHLTVI